MFESIKDPNELILSLVDFGSIDTDDMLVVCVFLKCLILL